MYKKKGFTPFRDVKAIENLVSYKTVKANGRGKVLPRIITSPLLSCFIPPLCFHKENRGENSKKRGLSFTPLENSSLTGRAGVTLVEVMVALLIFTIVMLGGFVFFFYGRTHIAHSNHQRMALELTKEKIELWKADDYNNIITQPASSISLGGIQFTRNTDMTEYPINGYKDVTVTTSWQERGNTYNVQLITIIAQ